MDDCNQPHAHITHLSGSTYTRSEESHFSIFLSYSQYALNMFSHFNKKDGREGNGDIDKGGSHIYMYILD